MSSTAPTQEIAELKGRLKATWEAGDFSEVAKHIEKAAEELVDRLDIRLGMKVLDVACGSGNLAVNAARKGAEVTGLDLAENLVEAAKRRAATLGLDINFEQGDAEAMRYDDNSFDVVMTMFGAMFAPRPELVASELVRVCKPGGRIAMANWTPTGLAGQMFALSGKYLPPPNMPPPVLWGVPGVVKERFGDKVSDLKMTTRMADMVYDMTPSKVVQLFRKYFGPTIMTFKAIPEDRHEELTVDMEALWTDNNQSDDGGTLVYGEYLEVVAIKR
jgi:ubiquinone/menaquinone biosynthesis C-methylase UbiE